MVLVDRDPSVWSELLTCQRCGQNWRVEGGAEYDRRTNVAFKIPIGQDWRTLDLKPGLRALEIRRRGGVSAERCAWSGCHNPCLKGARICVDHALRFAGNS
jgi:hypothetical protein